MFTKARLRRMERDARRVFTAVGVTRSGKEIMPETVGGMIFKAQEQYGLPHSKACFILAGMFQTHWPECVIKNWRYMFSIVARGADAGWALETWRAAHSDDMRLFILPENFFRRRIPACRPMEPVKKPRSP